MSSKNDDSRCEAAAPMRSTPKPSERRRADRVRVDVLANRFLDGYPYLCRLTDISAGGARVDRLNEPMLSTGGRYVGLQFQLPGCGEVLTASAEVVASGADHRGVSLHFTQLPATTALAIEGFVARRRLRTR